MSYSPYIAGAEILSIEAKDVYLANNLHKHNDIGYNVRYSKGDKTGQLYLRKFTGAFDYSLDYMHWEKIRSNYISERKEPRVYLDGIHQYTLDFINITFNYSVKLFNKSSSNVYNKIGFEYPDEELNDCVKLRGNEIVAIKVDSEVTTPLSDEQLGKYFYFDKAKNVYKAKNNIPSLMSCMDLRDWIYHKGFKCDGKNYVRWKRSTGSARVGKCLFIDERLYDAMHEWEMMGLDIKENDEIDLASLESYISLTLSSIIDTVTIQPENILVIPDYESKFETNSINTVDVDGKLVTSESIVEVSNSIFDGQSLIDKSLMGKYKECGMILLRNRFFKSCAFNTNIQKFFADCGIRDVSQLNGFTIAKSIEDIKLITTESSIKFVKFGNLDEWISRIDPSFGVVKHEKQTHHLNGNCVMTHYQLLNTLQMSYDEVAAFLHEPMEYLKQIRDDPAVLRNHIRYSLYNDDYSTPFLSNNDINYRLLGLNEKFSQTKLYEKFRIDVYTAYVKEIRRGHVMVQGNYSVLFGNPVEMLKHSIGLFDGTAYFEESTLCSRRFKNGECLVGSRSPHVVASCVLVINNKRYPLIDEYFNLTNEIVCVNSIGNALLDRLSGSDFDSDTILLTNNKWIVQAAKRNFDKLKISTNNVKAKKLKRKYNADQQVELDYITSNNIIGQDINLAQILNSMLWNNLNNGQTFDKNKELYYDICTLNILSNLAIDSAKREFNVNLTYEMNNIRDKYMTKNENGDKIKPYFFYYILKDKDLLDNSTDFKKFDTTMDFVESYIDSVIRKKEFRCGRKKSFLRFSDILNDEDYMYEKVNRRQVKQIKDIIENYSKNVKGVYSSNMPNNEKGKMARDLKEQCINDIYSLSINYHTAIYLLRYLDNEKYSSYYRKLFNIMFCEEDSKFLDLIKKSKEPLHRLKKSKNGDINLLGIRYKKVKSA